MDAIKYTENTADFFYDLVIADPPFFKEDIYRVVKNILTNNYLHKSSLMIIERSVQTKEKDIGNFSIDPFKIIGDTCLYRIKLK